MKITGFHKAAAMVVGITSLGLLEQHKVTNTADFLTGFGAALIGALFGALIIDLMKNS